jgi:hypothetical protein
MTEQKLTGKDLEGTKESGEKAKRAANQYFKELLNKLSTSIDLTNPNGLEMSAAFDRCVERVIKPIYPKGAKIRQTSTVDDKSGLRTVDWSFRDTSNKIQQAVQAAVDNFVQSWGKQRGLIDGQGKAVEGAGSIPMQVNGITPQVFNGTRTRILNPRTAASVAMKAVTSGGDFITDKNTGMSTWSVPDTALTIDGKNLSRSLRAEVREGDKRWLEGKVALSSLAEGASPANAEERAIATNNRNFRVTLAKYKAMTPEQEQELARLEIAKRERKKDFRADALQKFIEENPGSRLAIEEAIKTHNVTNREEKARLLAAERTPGTPEFQARVHRVLDRNEAQKKAVDAYAKANPKSDMARKKAAMKRRRVLTKSLGWLTVVVGAITGVINIGRKIFSSLLDVGSNVHKISMEGARFNMSAPEAAKLSARAKVMRMDEGVFSKVLGGLDAALAGPRSGEALNRFVNAVAPMSAQVSGKTIGETIQLFLNKSANPLELMQTGLDDAFNLALQGKNELGQRVAGGPQKAFSVLAKTLNSAQAGWGDILLEIGQKYYNSNDLGLQEAVRARVADGGHWLDAIADVMYQSEKAEAATNVANPNERNAAEEAGEKWNTLIASMGELWDSIKIKMLAASEAVHSAAEGLLRWVISIPGVRKLFPALNEYAYAVDKSNYDRNDIEEQNNKHLITAYTKIIEATVKEYGTTPEAFRQSMDAFKETPSRSVLPEKFRTDEGFKKWLALTGIQFGLEEAESKKKSFAEQRYNLDVAGEGVALVPDVSLAQRQRVVNAKQHAFFEAYMAALNASTEKLEPDDYEKREKRLRALVASYALNVAPDFNNMAEDERIAFVLSNLRLVEARYSSGVMPHINEYLALQEAKILDENMRGDNKGELYVHRRIEQSGNTFGMASLVSLGMVKAGIADALASLDTKYSIQAETGGTDLTVNVDATDGRSFHYVGKNLQDGTHNVRAQGSGSVLLDIEAWQDAYDPTPR